jgi:hypothetical protein
MKTIDCAELRMVSSELALNLLTGAERAAAIAHLEGCQECRADVFSLAATADELLELAPPVDPPVGFESRVLRTIAQEDRVVRAPQSMGRRRARRRRARGIFAVAAAAALVVALGVVLWPGTGSGVATATMRTRQGTVVGAASVSGDPPSLVVEMHGWNDIVRSYPSTGTSDAVLTLRHGEGTDEVLPLRAHRGSSWRESWKLPGTRGKGDITAVAIVGVDGQVWCSARFE